MRTFLNVNITIAAAILLASCTKDTLAPRLQDDPAQAIADGAASATPLLEDDATPASPTASATELVGSDTPVPSQVAQGTQFLEDDAANGNNVRPDEVFYLGPDNSSIDRIAPDGYTPLEPIPDMSLSTSNAAPF